VFKEYIFQKLMKTHCSLKIGGEIDKKSISPEIRSFANAHVLTGISDHGKGFKSRLTQLVL